MIVSQPYDVIFEKRSASVDAAVTVAITCYKYGRECIEAIDSVAAQTERLLDLIIVDDCSPDDSVDIIMRHLSDSGAEARFSNLRFLKHQQNHGLSPTRNTSIALTETPYIFMLDADNSLYSRAISALRGAIENTGAAMAYSLVETFGDQQGIIGNSIWNPKQFAYGNYIDAMALIRTDILREIGGYRILPKKFGWEDYDLWCSFVDRGLSGCHVPQILCRYRVNKGSMLRSTTNPFLMENLEFIKDDMERHHTFRFFFHV